MLIASLSSKLVIITPLLLIFMDMIYRVTEFKKRRFCKIIRENKIIFFVINQFIRDKIRLFKLLNCVTSITYGQWCSHILSRVK